MNKIYEHESRERELKASPKNTYLKFRNILISMIFVAVGFLAFTGVADAATTYYWVGGTTNSNTSNPVNWNTTAGVCADSVNATAPTTGDTINFVSNCVNDATIDSALSIATYIMAVGYTGTTTVSGVSMTVATSLVVNGGTLYITNGGTVTGPSGTGGIMIGGAATGNGTITITGSGSQLTQTISGTTRIRIGDTTGGIGNLNILNGASVSTGNIYAAYSTGTTANIIVDGVGTMWNSDAAGGQGFIGRQGTASLIISNGAVVNTAAGPWQIGGIAGSIGTVTVNGTGSQLNFTTDNTNLRVAFAGTGTLTVSGGATVSIPGTTGKITVADQAGSTGTINIDSGYTMDLIQAGTITTGLGTASLPPLTPTGLTSSNISQTSIDWDWDDLSGATGYKVYNASDNTLLTTISSATSNWTQNSLSPNTSHSIYVRGMNSQGEGYSSSDSSEVYTLNNTPTNLSASSDSNSITLTIDSFPNYTSGSSGYYFSRSDTNSGWIQNNSWTDTGLSCGHSYDYSVIYRNSDGVETDPISITKSTSRCPSFGSSAFSRYNNLMAMGKIEAANEIKQEFPNQITNNQIPLVPSTSTIPTVTPSTPLTLLRILKLVTPRMWGDDVKSLQTYLNEHNYNCGIADGIFGPKTKASVIAFQKASNIVTDGIVGPKTKTKMNAER